MSELKKEELLEVLDLWMKDEWNIKGGMVRALAMKGKKEKAKEMALEATLREQAYEQIKEMIQKFSEECVKSYKTGYKAGIVNENTRMRKNQSGVTEEWIKKKSQLLSNAIQVFVLEAAEELKTNVDSIKVAEDFIRSFIKEIHGRK